MSQKKTYIYHMLIGHDNKTEVDIFCYANNAGLAVEYCKELYKDKKYNSYQAKKVGVSLYPRETQIVSDGDAMKLRKAGADKDVQFSEREIERPTFIKKEDAKELNL